jgi:hypothetical protein
MYQQAENKEGEYNNERKISAIKQLEQHPIRSLRQSNTPDHKLIDDAA